jgi:transcriptional antiterminator Rof (Rho-off)
MKKYELSTLQGKNIVLDISELLKGEVLYVNATSLARQFGKDRRQLEKFLKTKAFIEYEKALFKVIQKSDFKTEEKGLKYSLKGKYGGTYLHNDLLIIFLRWLNPEFAVNCDLYIKHKIQMAHDEKVSARASISANKANAKWIEARDHGKDTRKLFTDKVKEFCEYAEEQRGKPYKLCPYYKHITDAIYDFIRVSVPRADQSPRDVYSGDVVESIESAELEVIKLLGEIIESNKSRKGIKPLIMDRLKETQHE